MVRVIRGPCASPFRPRASAGAFLRSFGVRAGFTSARPQSGRSRCLPGRRRCRCSCFVETPFPAFEAVVRRDVRKDGNIGPGSREGELLRRPRPAELAACSIHTKKAPVGRSGAAGHHERYMKHLPAGSDSTPPEHEHLLLIFTSVSPAIGIDRLLRPTLNYCVRDPARWNADPRGSSRTAERPAPDAAAQKPAD